MGTAGHFAELLCAPYDKVAASIRKLRKMDLVRKTKFRDKTCFMVSPLLVNYGNQRKRAFKVKLWEKAAIHAIHGSHS